MKYYKHSEEVEQRMFHLDVESLKQYSREFADAFDSGRSYSMTIELAELYKLLPRRYHAVKSYRRLQRYLRDKGIELEIVSKKTKSLLTNDENENESNHEKQKIQI